MSSISTTFNGQLDTQYIQMINSLMEIESQPLIKIQEQRDNYNVRKGVYSDLKSSLDKLQSSTKALMSTDALYSFNPGRKVVTNAANGTTVLTASATSSSAAASYTVHVTSLAKAHRIMSDKQSSMSAALNLSGNIEVGGVSLAVLSSDSLANIASKINNASYETGKEVVANVVDAQLILTSKSTGTGYTVTAKDTTGSVLKTLGVLNNDETTFKNERLASNAVFTINDLPAITRSSNTGLADVINGVTLNFAADAEGKDVTLEVQADGKSETDAINTFMKDFNSTTSYLDAKLATVKQADGTYKRGSLAGDNSLYSLRIDLLRQINTEATNAGTLKSLSQIGITLDTNMKLQVSDSTKLSEALSTNKPNVTKLIDAMMDKVNTMVGRFSGTSGYVATLQKTIDQQVKASDSQITQMTERLNTKQNSLYQQFAEAQAQITDMLYQQQRMSALFSSSS
jgi:flagellar hook-associated protein 2